MFMAAKNSVTEKLQRITVCGFGKLGTCVAACLAARGFEVVGIDIDRQKVESLRKGIAPVEEPKLQEMIERSGGRLRATTDFSEALATSQAGFLVFPLPVCRTAVLAMITCSSRCMRSQSR